MTTLGNIDGLSYMNIYTTSTEVEIENADKGKEIMLITNICIMVVFLLFILYHIFSINFEVSDVRNSSLTSHSEDLSVSLKRISLKDFAVKLTHIPYTYRRNIEVDVRNIFANFGSQR